MKDEDLVVGFFVENGAGGVLASAAVTRVGSLAFSKFVVSGQNPPYGWCLEF